jgi:MoxR-like ATPase
MMPDATIGEPQAPVQAAIATLTTIETEMNAMFLEREQAIRELFVSLLARQHCVLIGDPGTGKSAMIEEICTRVSDGTGNGLSLFSYLMTKFTQTDEVFGPVSFNGMKNETYNRVIAKRLPDSEIAFLDEIWKSSSAILNAVLKIVNERKFTNGTTVIDVPLMSIFAASNELPEGNDLEAIRDRMLLTHFVSHLSDANFELLMLRKAGLEPDPFTFQKTTIGRSDLVGLQAYTRTIRFTRPVISAFTAIRRELAAEGIIISERRNGHCLQLMQANTVMEGRSEVNEDDLAVLYDALWLEPSQRATVSKIINQHSNPINARASELKDEADTIYNQTMQALEANKQDRTKRTMAAAEGAGKLQKILDELTQLQSQAAKTGRSTKRLDQATAAAQQQHMDLLKAVGFKMNL